MAGKPPINDYDDIDSIQDKIDKYLHSEDEDNPLTFSGLAYALGYASRQSLWEVSKADHKISLPIKRALLYIESDYEKGLRSGAPTGCIFALKNRGWTDKTEMDIKNKDMTEAFRNIAGKLLGDS